MRECRNGSHMCVLKCWKLGPSPPFQLHKPAQHSPFAYSSLTLIPACYRDHLHTGGPLCASSLLKQAPGVQYWSLPSEACHKEARREGELHPTLDLHREENSSPGHLLALILLLWTLKVREVPGGACSEGTEDWTEKMSCSPH